MKKTRTIRDMADELYDDPDIVEQVVRHAEENGTTKRIESGECVLPHPHDARTWLQRVTGQEVKTQRERDTEARLAALEQLLAEIKDAKTPLPADRNRVLEERIAALEGKVA